MFKLSIVRFYRAALCYIQRKSFVMATADSDSEEKGPHGTRYLTDESQVFKHNAWDDVQWTPELEAAAAEKVAKNSKYFLDEEKQEKYEQEAHLMWDKFYGVHENRFFKDRQWLFREFPELIGRQELFPSPSDTDSIGEDTAAEKPTADDDSKRPLASCGESTAASVPTQESSEHACISGESGARGAACRTEVHSAEKRYILEVGCGVGNTVFPMLRTHNDPNFFVYCCDFSSTAIDIVRANKEYDPARCHAFVCDISSPDAVYPMADSSLDVVVLIFVLSAIRPDKMATTIRRLSRLLKPGGQLLFRDYGFHDMAQLRFKPGRCLAENFYVRGDGTRVYFFKQDELDVMFTGAALQKVQNQVVRRLQVNRARQLTMYRVWVQCKYCRPFSSSTSTTN